MAGNKMPRYPCHRNSREMKTVGESGNSKSSRRSFASYSRKGFQRKRWESIDILPTRQIMPGTL